MSILVAGFDFPDNKATIICRHSILGSQVLAIFHDEDGDIHISCGQEGHHEDDWMVVHLAHVIACNDDLLALPTVHMGEIAERSAKGQPWIVSKA